MIASKYRVERVLGEGGMGVVYEAEHVALRERVAIKLLHKKRSTDAEISRRFVSEARTSVKIKSDAVARVLDVGTTEDGMPFMVMEKLDGEDLGALIDRAGALTIEQAVDFMLQACEAVAAAHAVGIVHRDLKPSNLFVAEDSARELHIKVLDFGISKVFDAAPDSQRAVTTTSAVLGSPGYMSPEQMRASRDVDARSDVWALGMILWESIAGVPMYAGKTYPEICAKVLGGHFLRLAAIGVTGPAELEQAIEKALSLQVEDRFASVAEFAAAIAPFGPRDSNIRLMRISNLARAPSDRQRRTPSLRPPVGLSPTVPALPTTGDPPRAQTEGPVAKDTNAAPRAPNRRVALYSLLAAAIAGVVIILAVRPGRGVSPPVVQPLTATASASPSASPSASQISSPTPPPTPSAPPSSASPRPSAAPSSKPTSAPSSQPSAAPQPSSTIKPPNGAPILH